MWALTRNHPEPLSTYLAILKSCPSQRMPMLCTRRLRGQGSDLSLTSVLSGIEIINAKSLSAICRQALPHKRINEVDEKLILIQLFRLPERRRHDKEKAQP